MKTFDNNSAYLPATGVATLSIAGRLLAGASLGLMLLSGCRSAAPDDSALTRSVQSTLNSDSALNGLGVQANVQNGVATLSGSAQNDAQRTLAARDASGVAGIRQVVNNLSIAPTGPAQQPAAATETQAPAAIPVPIEKTPDNIRTEDRRQQREAERQREAEQRREQQQAEQQQRMASNQPAPIERSHDRTDADSNTANNRPAPPVPQAPPQPVFRDITVPAGYAIAVRVTQTIDSADAQEGQTFSGVVANNVMADGVVAIPAGAHISGRVDTVQEAAHFKGNSLLTVSLTSVNSRGENLPVGAEPYTVQGKGRGKNTAEKTGGGAAVGAILGGIFGGGKGAAIGAVAGGGVGAGSNAITRGEQVQIPSESTVRFRLTRPIALHVRVDGQENSPADNDPALQHRSPQ